MRDDVPETIEIHDEATPKCFANTFTSRAFAFPSAAGAFTETRNDPSCIRSTDSFFAFGFTLTEIFTVGLS